MYGLLTITWTLTSGHFLTQTLLCDISRCTALEWLASGICTAFSNADRFCECSGSRSSAKQLSLFKCASCSTANKNRLMSAAMKASTWHTHARVHTGSAVAFVRNKVYRTVNWHTVCVLLKFVSGIQMLRWTPTECLTYCK